MANRRRQGQRRRDSSIFGTARALPRGPHRLTRSQVAASQRARLMAAIAEVVAERGYAAATIGEIASGAGVSRRTFYEHFTDKEDCYLAAYDVLTDATLGRMRAELARVARVEEWRPLVSRLLSVYLSTLSEEPAAASAFLIEVQGAGPRARRRRREVHREFAQLLRAAHELIREQDPSLGAVPERTYLATVGGISELVSEALERSPRKPLTALRRDILFWIEATVEGAAKAAESSDGAAAPAARAS